MWVPSPSSVVMNILDEMKGRYMGDEPSRADKEESSGAIAPLPNVYYTTTA